VLRNLYISHFCWSKASLIREKKLKSFSLEEVITSVDSENSNSLRLVRMGASMFLLNPSVRDLYPLVSYKPRYLISKIGFVCTPLHWLHLCRFLLSEAFGKIVQIEVSILTWKARDGRKWTQKTTMDAMHLLLESVRKEKSNIASLLELLPSLAAMKEALDLEVSRLATISSKAFDPSSTLGSEEENVKEHEFQDVDSEDEIEVFDDNCI